MARPRRSLPVANTVFQASLAILENSRKLPPVVVLRQSVAAVHNTDSETLPGGADNFQFYSISCRRCLESSKGCQLCYAAKASNKPSDPRLLEELPPRSCLSHPTFLLIF